MNFDGLAEELKEIAGAKPVDAETESMLETAFKSKAQQKVHIHHFIFGIPSMFISWALFALGQGWWAGIVAGITAALFLSELKELITQQWQP
jgi:Mn2+/Fe2+ NRAMP family transporter